VQVYRKSRHIGVEILNPWPYIDENITGHVRYRRLVAVNLTVSFDWDDEYSTTSNVITLKGPPANDPSPYFGGSFYYGGTSYYNQGFSAARRVASMNINPAGKGPGFFVSLSASTSSPFPGGFFGARLMINRPHRGPRAPEALRGSCASGCFALPAVR
jgi:hypothetical protein